MRHLRVAGKIHVVFHAIENAGHEEREDDQRCHERCKSFWKTVRANNDRIGGERGKDENDRKRSDCAQSMRESFDGHEFRHEHRGKPRKEECMDDETVVFLLATNTCDKKADKRNRGEEDADREQRAADWIKKRIGWIVMAPILIAPDVIFRDA